jgi:hypothetical protein
MKTILIILLATFGFATISQAQTTPQVPQSLDSLQNKVMKLMQFYESYDDGSPESLKKAKYNDAINELFDGAASEKDKADAYPIIDAYIKGDKALEQNSEQKERSNNDFNEAIGNTDEAKAAMNFVNQQASALQNMSYSEFEKYVEKASPFVSKSEIKRAYNEMHKTDEKKVAVTPADEEMTDTQKQVWAFGILENPKNYEEFRKACKILNPKFSDTEIRKVWENRDK